MEKKRFLVECERQLYILYWKSSFGFVLKFCPMLSQEKDRVVLALRLGETAPPKLVDLSCDFCARNLLLFCTWQTE